MAGTTLIKQQALIMATSDDKGYDLEKYTQKVKDELDEAEADEEHDQKTCNAKQKSFEELMYGIKLLRKMYTLKYSFYIAICCSEFIMKLI